MGKEALLSRVFATAFEGVWAVIFLIQMGVAIPVGVEW